MNKRTETDISKDEEYVLSITNIKRLRFKRKNIRENERFRQSNKRMFMSKPQTKSYIILFEKVKSDGTKLHNRRQENAHYSLSVTELKNLRSKNQSTNCNFLRSQKSSVIQDSQETEFKTNEMIEVSCEL